ncbi:MAG TPA: GntR family transcriptional regulator [Streptomyces sp.]|uniref:GntR family transcriptional regulator n=1 Tax=Streptomyces sp. TaxID=1931 RepID=UPI002BC66B0C|nr:GntR family transcriptional regulator [Streptomyces sp.]HWU06468.1 GntR family transcriptional regulator [Streptomyces sp.]
MTTTPLTIESTPDTENAGLVQPTYRQLREALDDFQRATESVNVRTDRAENREMIRQLVLPWLALAKARLSEAEGSPSDQARWQEIIAGVQPPPAGAGDGPDVGTLLHNAVWLFSALLAAAERGPGVREITERMRELIATGTYPPGSLLGIGRIAAEVEGPAPQLERVRLAARDLEAEGLLTLTPAGRIRIAGRSVAVDRPAQIAAWLRVLIQAGVYQPSHHLPTRPALTLMLVARPHDVTRAIHLLHEEGVTSPSRGGRACLRAKLPFPVVPAPDMESLISRLATLALPDTNLSHTAIGDMCRRARTQWHGRRAPDPQALHRMRRALAAAAEHLLPMAATRYPNDPYVYAVLRRTAVTALATVPPDRLDQCWRTACLGAAVREVLVLLGDAT